MYTVIGSYTVAMFRQCQSTQIICICYNEMTVLCFYTPTLYAAQLQLHVYGLSMWIG